MALLTFLGATQQVTGSCYLIETRDGAKVLLECGMRQGHHEAEEGNRAPFAFDPNSLNAVVLSHAHLDHSGLLPRLVAAGYRGPIFATEATCELLELMLLDSAHLQERDAEWENKWRARTGQPAITAVYTVADVEQTLKQLQPIAYACEQQVAAGVRVTYHDAGHILGSAIVELLIEDHHLQRRLVFSGDLGNTCSPLMHDPQILTRADVLMMESTYGDRDHRCTEETLDEFAAILQAAHRDGGKYGEKASVKEDERTKRCARHVCLQDCCEARLIARALSATRLNGTRAGYRVPCTPRPTTAGSWTNCSVRWWREVHAASRNCRVHDPERAANPPDRHQPAWLASSASFGTGACHIPDLKQGARGEWWAWCHQRNKQFHPCPSKEPSDVPMCAQVLRANLFLERVQHYRHAAPRYWLSAQDSLANRSATWCSCWQSHQATPGAGHEYVHWETPVPKHRWHQVVSIPPHDQSEGASQ